MSEEVITTEQQTLPTIWNNSDMLAKAYKAANYLASSDLVPVTYKKPENCLIALDMANRTGMQPLTIMQNLYIVKGKPSWSGQMCIALINTSGRFTPLEYEFVGTKGQDDFGCYAYATKKSNGKLYTSDAVTISMAKKEGWFGKDGSKWQTMPIQMMMYRAGAFFARVYCPEVLIGLPLVDEVIDISANKSKALNEELDAVINGDIKPAEDVGDAIKDEEADLPWNTDKPNGESGNADNH